MQYLALYRKYRPTSFDDVVGQDKIVSVIKNEIKNNRISHAYLFSGPRGTGKTTTAKIIAKLVNCTNLQDGEACGKCESCLNFKNNSDIVEIDAASNNGVDEIRELRDKVNLVPSNSKYKVYIIDEVHMLTTQAFNALLKTLEEPPAHAIFILATTEVHKIPLTVASRCQKFQFSKINNDEIVKRLKSIIENEKIAIDDFILYEIARLSDGGLRDAINMLDQLIAYKEKNITLDDVYNINGTVSYVDLYNFILNLKNNKVEEIINFIEKIDEEGKSLAKFIEEIIVFLKDILLYKNANIECELKDKNNKIISLSKILEDKNIYNIIYTYNDTLNDMKISSNPLILFIISSIRIIKENFNNKDNNIQNIIKTEEKITNKETRNDIENNKQKIEKNTLASRQTPINKEFIDIRVNNTLALANKEQLNKIKKDWNKINDFLLNEKYGINSGILKDTEVKAAGGEYLILGSKFESIIDKVNSKLIELEDTLYQIFNEKYKIIALKEEDWIEEKNKYIINIKNGVKYNLKEEKAIFKESQKEKTAVDELVDIIGSDIIEFE